MSILCKLGHHHWEGDIYTDVRQCRRCRRKERGIFLGPQSRPTEFNWIAWTALVLGVVLLAIGKCK